MHTVPIPETKKAAKAEKLANQVALFSSLPDCARVSVDVVSAITGRSPASIWRDVAKGRLAKPVKVGLRSTRWSVGDLRLSLSAQSIVGKAA